MLSVMLKFEENGSSRVISIKISADEKTLFTKFDAMLWKCYNKTINLGYILKSDIFEVQWIVL